VKVGVFAVLFEDRPFAEALDLIAGAGCEAVELRAGPDGPCDPRALLADAGARQRLSGELASRGLEVSALSCHGNPLHPDGDRAAADDLRFRDTVRLAAELGIGTVVTFSGCPGESATSQRPSWVVARWPPDFVETLEWQWRERVLPYWQEAAAFVQGHGVRVAIEPHPGFVVYHAQSFARLHAAAGDAVGVNFDPSHLFWQGIDPLVAVRELAGSIYHVHAKDTLLRPAELAAKGVLDTTATEPGERPWHFVTVGDGHGADFWGELVRELRTAGFDGALSIEHEDPLRDREDGFRRAASFLREVLAGA
jgi:sugar phosphate isomerase/epimerase